MDVVVLVKYVPDPAGTPKIGEDLLVQREGTDGTLDPGDEYAVEAGLQAVETHGGEVTLVSMGPEIAMGAVRKGLSMGAHQGVLVTDPNLRGADALATARVLAATIGHRPFDLVLTGAESTDGYTGTLPMAVAELLGIPALTFARRIHLEGDGVRIERQTDLGYDVLEGPLPALVSVTGSASEPRYATLKGIMASKTKPVEELALADLGLSSDDVAPTQHVRSVSPAAVKGPGEIVEGEEAVARIVGFLAEAKVI
ncbi:MAG TPA: electron transfer flavoprotein subunit beta/FixA family protein [Actinomycetota bacterium]|nr:electron transfer flavoprotein subunit beta/FixA family protein [Actinomycetota bacterium]